MSNTPDASLPDSLQRFIFEQIPVRGEMVHLDASWQNVIDRHEYPEVLRNIMGELAAAAVLFAATLKLRGSLILQIMGNGPVKLLVVECNGDMKLRATAKWTGDITHGSLTDLIGEGQFSITLDPKDGGQPYQGIVDAEGASIAEVMQNYMSSSEQLDTRLWLAADGKCAAGMLLQKLPEQQREDFAQDDDAWNRVVTLADTLQADELKTLSAKTLIHRLFHEDDVRLFDAQVVEFFCSCSRENVASMLKMLGKEEVDSILAEQGRIDVHCEFCNQRYEFDKVDAGILFVGATFIPGSDTRH